MADLEQLLIATSRTFALAIPLLPEPTRREVTLSYLLFRIADTFEDAASWPRALRIEALDRFDALLEAPDREEIAAVSRRWAEEVPCEQLGYRELLAELPCVLDAFFALSPRGRRADPRARAAHLARHGRLRRPHHRRRRAAAARRRRTSRPTATWWPASSASC